MQTSRRTYRQNLCPAGMEHFTVTVKETDLWIAVDHGSCSADLPAKVEQFVWQQRRLLETYLQGDPEFALALRPYLASSGAPSIALEMVRAGNLAGVGPMAAVAGAFAQFAGEWLQLQGCREVIVENGGDIFLSCNQPIKIGVLTGESSFDRGLAVKIKPRAGSCGVCTSSGTQGHAYSQGRADAAVILADRAALADAVATAAANLIQVPADLKSALHFTRGIRGVQGALLLLEDKMAAWGQLELV